VHPRSETPSYSRAVAMVGLALGVILGSHIHYNETSVNNPMGNLLWSFLKWPVQLLYESPYWKDFSLDTWRIFIRLTFGISL
jgi:hypothetical protein